MKTVLLSLLLFVLAVAPAQGFVQGEKVFTLVQEWRARRNLPVMVVDNKLCRYSAIRAEEIKTDWSHTGFKKRVSPRLYREGNYRRLGENLAKDFSTEQGVVNGWLNSRTHRQNIEYPYTRTCVVCSSNYCVQLFGL